MPTFRAPRGTRDLLPDDRAVFDRLGRVASSLTARYGYRPIETPLFEQAAVFERGIGSVTDVVEKELFRIAPRTEESESWALRPEPTAGIVRAYVQHGMQTWPQPVKLTTIGPMFRYDRPQAGRYRQFWQFDVEAIGDPGPAVDAEIIELGHAVLRRGGGERRRGAGQLDRRPGVPPRLHRRAGRVLPRARRRAAADGARSARAQRAPPARLQGPGDGRDQRRRAADHGSPVRGMCGALRERPRAPRRARRADPGRARAGPRPRLLHADRVRVLRGRSRGPAAGAGRRRPVRRTGPAARRPADARDRVRDRAGPGGAGARRAGGRGERRRRRTTGRWPSWSGPTRRTRSAG